VEPLMSVFRIAVTRKVGMAGNHVVGTDDFTAFQFQRLVSIGAMSRLFRLRKSTCDGDASVD
jgi:hypothetical protein